MAPSTLPGAALAAPTWTASAPGAPKRRFLVEYDVSAVVDRENGFDLVAGYWKDDRGVEGHGPIDCYEEEPEGDLLILHAFMVSLVCGVRDAKQLVEVNPRVLRFDFGQEEEGGTPGHELVFDVKEYTEAKRRLLVNPSFTMPMASGDADIARPKI